MLRSKENWVSYFWGVYRRAVTCYISNKFSCKKLSPVYLAPLPPTKTDFCISLFEQVYLLSPRPSSLSAWNEIMRALSAENNQTRVCIHFSERAWLCMFHSSLVFLNRVVKWVTAVLVSLQVGTCGNVEGGGGWVVGGLWVKGCWLKPFEMSRS